MVAEAAVGLAPQRESGCGFGGEELVCERGGLLLVRFAAADEAVAFGDQRAISGRSAG